MKSTCKLMCLLACVVTLADAQTRIDLKSQGRNVDFSDATSTRPFKVGTTLPATCKTGDMFFLTTAPAGNNTFGCIATNVWSSEGASSGTPGAVNSVSGKSGTVTLEASDINDCRLSRASATTLAVSACSFGFPGLSRRVLAPSTVTLLSGSGLLYVYARPGGNLEVIRNGTLSVACDGCVDAGTATDFPADGARIGRWTATAGQWDVSVSSSDERTFLNGPLQVVPDQGIRITGGVFGEKKIGVDTAVVQTRAAAQSAAETLCLGSGTATAQTCSLSPLLGAYTPGMVIRIRPSATNTGALTLNVNSLGAIAVRAADGTANLSAGEMVAGIYYQLVYDGTYFRSLGIAGAKMRITQYIGAMRSASGTSVLNSSLTNWGTTIQGSTLNTPASTPVYSWSSATLPDNVPAGLDTHFALHPQWLSGSGLNVRVHYYVSSTPAPVSLRAEVSCTGTGDSVLSPFAGIASSAAVSSTPAGAGLQSVATLAFPGSALVSACSGGKIAHLRMWRDGADAYTGSLEITGVETEYWAGVN